MAGPKRSWTSTSTRFKRVGSGGISLRRIWPDFVSAPEGRRSPTLCPSLTQCHSPLRFRACNRYPRTVPPTFNIASWPPVPMGSRSSANHFHRRSIILKSMKRAAPSPEWDSARDETFRKAIKSNAPVDAVDQAACGRPAASTALCAASPGPTPGSATSGPLRPAAAHHPRLDAGVPAEPCLRGRQQLRGNGHWDVSIEVADAAYSQTAGSSAISILRPESWSAGSSNNHLKPNRSEHLSRRPPPPVGPPPNVCGRDHEKPPPSRSSWVIEGSSGATKFAYSLPIRWRSVAPPPHKCRSCQKRQRAEYGECRGREHGKRSCLRRRWKGVIW